MAIVFIKCAINYTFFRSIDLSTQRVRALDYPQIAFGITFASCEVMPGRVCLVSSNAQSKIAGQHLLGSRDEGVRDLAKIGSNL